VLYSFGRGDYGSLGIGISITTEPGSSKKTPQEVKFPKQVRIASINAGDRNALALTDDKELYTWGFNEEGTTGLKSANPKITDIHRPTLLKLDVELHGKSYHCQPVQLSAGGQHSLVLVRPSLNK
jgi:alpha-tubulin suppressor-like RCC1 family protein